MKIQFPGGSGGKESAAIKETWLWSLGWEDTLEKEMAFQYSFLENFKDRVAWQATVHGVTKSQTRPSNEHFKWLKNNNNHNNKIFTCSLKSHYYMQILSRHCRLDVETKETQSYPQGAYNLVRDTGQ